MSLTRPGVFVLSIDVELAWGVCDRPLGPAARPTLLAERAVVRCLLELFARYDVRATWAVVGHLLLERCPRERATWHPEIPRPVPTRDGRDWFFQHPEDPDDPLWYGRDLVEWIAEATPRQEIGSHSFAHLIFDPAVTPGEAIRADLARARRLHDAHGLPFVSFVFPRNVVGYRDLLAAAGVQVYRGVVPTWCDRVPAGPLRRLARLLDFALAVPPPTVEATRDGLGLVNVPDSMLLLGRNGLRRLVPARQVVRKARAGLERAAATGRVFHLRFHPSNLAHRPDRQLDALEAILRHAAALRRAGRLEIRTMGEFARAADAALSASADVVRRGGGAS